ncbi:olfactory receptor class A-like protein 1 [Protopterus annectens]|uniref:olfactory receptor class A-like protein 1 n=1 Tax=Protopterus annectens TaxID=7888 RepID=UPI001CFAFE09|nr:olfactory receptor class A-like protein 1 [Protopterus annectens]
MDVRAILKATGFILILVIGIPANLSILMSFFTSAVSEKKLMPTDFILTKLSFVNVVVVLVRGIPQSLTAIGMQKLFNDYGCKFVIFTYRVCRAMSVCITAVLSIYQCIVLLPPTTKFMALKQKVSQNIFLLFLLLWCINCIIYIPAGFMYSQAEVNSSIPKYALNLEFCFVLFPHEVSYRVNGIVYTFRDFLFVGLMTLASSYIVIILYKHNKKLQNIRSPDQKQKSATELRAAKAVVILVTLYLVLFGLDNAIWMYTLSVSNVAPAVSDARVFFASLYTAVSPLVIIGTNRKIQQKLKCTSANIEHNKRESSVTHIAMSKEEKNY